MPSLPLKLQVGVRDHWTNPDSDVQKAIKSLQELLGYDVVVDPEWQLLLAELDLVYTDKSQFASAVAGTVKAWCVAMSELLDDEANEEWTEGLLERLKESWSRLKLFVEVSKSTSPSTAWSSERGGFIISLPKTHISYPPEYLPLFKGEILRCFNEKAGAGAAACDDADPADSLVVASTTGGDDWSDVAVDKTTGKLAVVDPSQAGSVIVPVPSVPKPTYLPDVKTLGRPDELLLRPPYHLVVYARGKTEVEVQCSHSPTLQVLAEYLKKWCRVNHQMSTKPPAVEIQLYQCAFGLGLMYDRLTLTAENRYGGGYNITPTMILSLVEGVFGYEKVSSDGGAWTYRRDAEFKRLP